MLQPLRKMVELQLQLGFPMELVEQHLNGTGAREGETGEEGSVLKFNYKKRRYVMAPPKKPVCQIDGPCTAQTNKQSVAKTTSTSVQPAAGIFNATNTNLMIGVAVAGCALSVVAAHLLQRKK